MIMKEELTNLSTNIIVPFLVGGAVGAGVALLLAPKPGKELRRDIKRFGTSTKDRIVLAVDKGKVLYGEGKAAVANAIDASVNAFVHEKEKWTHS